MRIQRFEDLKPATPVREGFRSGSIEFHDLMGGVEGTAENYGLQMVDVHDRFSTPRHRHNFEQVRVMLDGSFGFGPNQVQHKGSVGYFCEGTYYTQAAEGRSTTLLLQIGGPSRQGFMNRAQLRRGIEALSARGTFADGIYTWNDEHGKKHNQDSFEAVWEHVHGRPVTYPRPQYAAPVLLEPEHFEWLDDRAAAGAAWRSLGRFNGFGLTLAQLRLADGASCDLEAKMQPLLVFCQEGAGSIEAERYSRWTTLQIDQGRAVKLSAGPASLFFVFGLPRFESGGVAAPFCS